MPVVTLIAFVVMMGTGACVCCQILPKLLFKIHLPLLIISGFIFMLTGIVAEENIEYRTEIEKYELQEVAEDIYWYYTPGTQGNKITVNQVDEDGDTLIRDYESANVKFEAGITPVIEIMQKEAYFEGELLGLGYIGKPAVEWFSEPPIIKIVIYLPEFYLPK